MTRLQGLAPLVSPATQVLVLGSFPGVRSLQLQQYYAHPHNQFWPILQQLWPQAGWPPDGDYARRCACALAQGLGIWDVYANCEREGSLDSAIRKARLNDFPGLLRALPTTAVRAFAMRVPWNNRWPTRAWPVGCGCTSCRPPARPTPRGLLNASWPPGAP